MNCQAMEALPVITVLFGFFCLITSALQLLPADTKFRRLANLKLFASSHGITMSALIMVTTVFSVATLASQLATPMAAGTLADQSQKPCAANPITLGNGMALSSASTALFVFLFLMLMVKTENIGKAM